MSVVPPDFVETGVNSILIAPAVFETIATSATMEVPGVAQMSSGFVQDFFGKKGVKVDIAAEHVVIHVSIVVEYGSQIPAVVRQIQEKVQEHVEAMTGFTVKACHINVQGIQLADSTKSKS
jgi:uncharacterized alkaline shock family protein YloU